MSVRQRTAEYLREGYGGVNVEKLLTFVVLGGVAYLAWKLYKGAQSVGAGIDSAEDALAKAIVGKPMEVADGIQYELPSGNRIDASTVNVTGNAPLRFDYLGKRYKVVLSLGGGVYKAVAL